MLNPFAVNACSSLPEGSIACELSLCWWTFCNGQASKRKRGAWVGPSRGSLGLQRASNQGGQHRRDLPGSRLCTYSEIQSFRRIGCRESFAAQEPWQGSQDCAGRGKIPGQHSVPTPPRSPGRHPRECLQSLTTLPVTPLSLTAPPWVRQ